MEELEVLKGKVAALELVLRAIIPELTPEQQQAVRNTLTRAEFQNAAPYTDDGEAQEEYKRTMARLTLYLVPVGT